VPAVGIHGISVKISRDGGEKLLDLMIGGHDLAFVFRRTGFAEKVKGDLSWVRSPAMAWSVW
jgi:hypothetical protein